MKISIFRSWKTRIVSVCLENRIALYSPHTSWDNLRGSIGDWLARSLPYSESNIILASPADSNYGCGRLAVVDPSTTITLEDAIERVKKHTGVKTVQVAIGVKSSLKSKIHTYAVCAGSGSSVLKGIESDLFITGKILQCKTIKSDELKRFFFEFVGVFSFQVKCHIMMFLRRYTAIHHVYF